MLVLQEGSFEVGDKVVSLNKADIINPMMGTVASKFKVNKRNGFVVNWHYEDGDCEEIEKESDLVLVSRA